MYTGEKPDECKDNEKALKKLYHTQNERTHAGEKIYDCKKCGKFFHEKACLTQHQRTHTTRKPSKCNDSERVLKKESCLTPNQRIKTRLKQERKTVKVINVRNLSLRS
ncbi:zinc finger protein 620-like [Hylobates moloch]|uniref:zinc finger protein 620-like n=1 Tax=Hylobates moloch TaxID=81572 RepID=UPI001362D22F|nr:zinc finger protein 620-like [Hylobates moloch]